LTVYSSFERAGQMPIPARFDNLPGDAIRVGELKEARRAAIRQGRNMVLYSLLLIILSTALSCAVLDMFYGISMSAWFSSTASLTLQSAVDVSSTLISLSVPAVSISGKLMVSSTNGFVLDSTKPLAVPNSHVAIGRDTARYALDLNGTANIDGDLKVQGQFHPSYLNITDSTIYMGDTSTKSHYYKPNNLSFARLVVSDLEFDSSYLDIIDTANVAGVTFNDGDISVPGQLTAEGVLQADGNAVFSGGKHDYLYLCYLVVTYIGAYCCCVGITASGQIKFLDVMLGYNGLALAGGLLVTTGSCASSRCCCRQTFSGVHCRRHCLKYGFERGWKCTNHWDYHPNRFNFSQQIAGTLNSDVSRVYAQFDLYYNRLPVHAPSRALYLWQAILQLKMISL
jgi:hypothetical protein